MQLTAVSGKAYRLSNVCLVARSGKFKLICNWVVNAFWFSSINIIAFLTTCELRGFINRLRQIKKSNFQSRHVCPHRTTRFPLDGFPWNLILGCFSKTCRENVIFTKIWQLYWELHMYAYVHTRSYLAQVFLEWQVFQMNLVQKLEQNISYSVTLILKQYSWWGIVKIWYSQTDYTLH